MRLGVAGAANCTLSAPSYGSHRAKVTTYGDGWTIVSEEASSRARRAFYPIRVIDSAWYIEVMFSSVQERDAFNIWLLGYIRQMVNPYRLSSRQSPMTVSIPSQRIVRTGIPTSPVDFSDSYERATHQSLVQFTLVNDPNLSGVGASKYVASRGQQGSRLGGRITAPSMTTRPVGSG